VRRVRSSHAASAPFISPLKAHCANDSPEPRVPGGEGGLEPVQLRPRDAALQRLIEEHDDRKWCARTAC
jgi:hypothetical protein